MIHSNNLVARRQGAVNAFLRAVHPAGAARPGNYTKGLNRLQPLIEASFSPVCGAAPRPVEPPGRLLYDARHVHQPFIPPLAPPGLAVALLLAACLGPLAAPPAWAKVPEPLKPPAGLSAAQREDLESRRGELLLQWDGLVRAVRAHNQQCQGVVLDSPQGVRCQVELKGIKERIGAHLEAVERYNLSVAAAELRLRQSSQP